MNSSINPTQWSVGDAAVCISATLILAIGGCHFSGTFFTFRGVTTTTSQQGIVNADITQVEISNQFGDVNIDRADGEPNWKWDAKVWAGAKPQVDQFIKELVMDVKVVDGKQTWTLLMPPDTSGLNGVQSNLTLRVSADTIVKLENAHGNVSVANLASDVEIDNRHGNALLDELSGNLKASNAHGDLQATNIKDRGNCMFSMAAQPLLLPAAHLPLKVPTEKSLSAKRSVH